MAASASGRRRSPFTVRAVLLGVLLCLCIALGAPYSNMVLRGSYLALDFSTPGAIFLFFILTGGVNVALGIIRPGLALDRGELLVVYIMMIVATAIPTLGLTEYLLPIITAPQYYATPENEWATLVLPHIPKWVVPQDGEAVKWFYEGAPAGRTIPWRPWVIPLCYWSVAIGSLYAVMISSMVVLRRQWAEHERLIYPIVQVPLDMVRESPDGSLIRPFFRSPLMWAGFLLPVLIGSIKGLHAYYNFVPDADLVTTLRLFRNTVGMQFRISFPMIGFSYLINLDIAFGLWFFNVVGACLSGLMRMAGISSTENIGPYGAFQDPILAHQSMGAMVILVLFGLWMARGHLRLVIDSTLGRREDVDDSDEIMSYRAAVLTFLVGLLVLSLCLHVAGLALWAALAAVLLAALIFVGVTRVVVEGGVAEAHAPLVAYSALVSAVGSTALGPAGMVSLAFTYVWAGDIRTFVMASCAHALKLGEHLGPRLRPLLWVMILAIAVSFAGSVWMVLHLAYEYGGINLNAWFFGSGARNAFVYTASMLNTPTGPNWWGWLHTGIGAGIMSLLMLARQRLLWWPLHPLGYPIGVIWAMNQIWFSIFLAWLIKMVVLTYGGARLFRRIRPFFLGLIAGQFVIAGFWLCVDFLTGMTDNMVFWM